MKPILKLKESLQNGSSESVFKDVYIDDSLKDYQSQRYLQALEHFVSQFGDGDACLFSAPGRSEIGGNHTDHQHGHVLAASIHQDVIAVVRPTDAGTIRFISEGYDLVTIPLNDLEAKKEEEGTTKALVKGILAGFVEKGYAIGAFDAYLTSDVLIGAGLSSSAAFETIIGTILSHLYNEGSISAVEIAILGQYAENVYFGKPCGLMDQMACSVGSLVHIDFHDPSNPVVEQVAFDLAAHGYCLCVTDTKGSHANLTDEYAAIPLEMKTAAQVFGKEFLGDVTLDEVYSHIPEIRQAGGDRAVLRAIHFVEETGRAQKETEALKSNDMNAFLQFVKESGDSSYKYLQNTYSTKNLSHQEICVALAASDHLLDGKGVSRVHGGGFAGTIQAFVPLTMVESYRSGMNAIFGEGSCNALYVRKYGGLKIEL